MQKQIDKAIKTSPFAGPVFILSYIASVYAEMFTFSTISIPCRMAFSFIGKRP